MPPPAVTPDTTIRALDPLDQPVVRYHIGEGNWASTMSRGLPWIPDLARPPNRVLLSDDQVIDVLILGDGYVGRATFEDELSDWVNDFYALEVYRQFAGAFRIRALYTKSEERCDLRNRDSYYHVKADDDGVFREDDDDKEWWNDGASKNAAFRAQLQDSLDCFALNQVRYSTLLSVGSDTVIHNELAGLKSNLVVVMLVRTENSKNATGMTRVVDALHLNVAFGSHSIHEFGHAFAYLEDEYISKRGGPPADRSNPTIPSVFTLSNLTFNPRLSAALWGHLSPWGTYRRTASGAQRCPVVGWLWRGGEDDLGVWHSEYHCLMNGRNHENYAYSPAEGDETKNTDLRFRDPVMFCLWCQEIVVLRTLEKTGQLAREGDPADVNAKGWTWYARWVQELRPLYWEFFDLPRQILEREQVYAHPERYPNAETFEELKDSADCYRPVDGADLYQPFQADPSSQTPPAPWSDAEELLVANA